MPKKQPTHVLTARQRGDLTDALAVAGAIEKLAEAAERGPESIRAARLCDDLLWMLKNYAKPEADATLSNSEEDAAHPRKD